MTLFVIADKDSFIKNLTCSACRRNQRVVRAKLRTYRLVWVLDVHRHQDGRLHYHVVAVAPVDIRTGFDFAALKAADRAYSWRDYWEGRRQTQIYAASACTWLRDEWRFWRRLTNYDGRHPELPYAGFGRWRFKPVKEDADRVGG